MYNSVPPSPLDYTVPPSRLQRSYPRHVPVLTFRGSEEVEEGVVGHGLGDGAHRAPALVLLLLLDGFQRDVLALGPVDHTAGEEALGQASGNTPASGHRHSYSSRRRSP